MCTQNDETQHNLPCLYCQPHSYIRMVQHMIERCILLRMTRDECVKALDHHARIKPLVTLTDVGLDFATSNDNCGKVKNCGEYYEEFLGSFWRGLQRENKDFFETYGHFVSPRPFLGGYVRRSPRFARRIQ